MPTTNQSIALLLVSDNPSLVEATRTNLASNSAYQLYVKKSRESLTKLIADVQPKLILLDLDFDAQPISLIQELISTYPQIATVPILSDVHMAQADQVMLSGASTFVKYPYQPDALTLSIGRAIAFLRTEMVISPPQETEAKAQPGHVFTVFSPKGGAGTTTVAINLAISLQKQTKEDVLLIDGKHLFGHVALYLNLRTGNSLTDLIPHNGAIDRRLLDQVVVPHVSGIKVLPSPLSIPEGQGIRPEDLFKILQVIQQFYPYIIIDAGNNLNDNAVTYMDASDKILLVANPNIASLRDSRQFMDVTATLSYPREKTLLLLNQAGKKSDVKKEEIEEILKMKVFGVIPSDDKQALASLNEGVPMVVRKPNHPISRGFGHIAKNLVQLMQAPGLAVGNNKHAR